MWYFVVSFLPYTTPVIDAQFPNESDCRRYARYYVVTQEPEFVCDCIQLHGDGQPTYVRTHR